jgi:hypothetical protein
VVRPAAWEELQVCKVAKISVAPDWNPLGHTIGGFNGCSTGEGLEIEVLLFSGVETLAGCKSCSLIEARLEVVVADQ